MDAEIGWKFGSLVEAARQDSNAHPFNTWRETQEGSLALIIVLAQFPRSIHRGTALSFSSDSIALDIAQSMVASGTLHHLPPPQQLFVILCFMNVEDVAVAEQGFKMMVSLGARSSRMSGPLKVFRQHLEILREFGRCPHRNKALGRVSTQPELQFMGALTKLPLFIRQAMKAEKEDKGTLERGGLNATNIVKAAGIAVSEYGTVEQTKHSKAKVLVLHYFRASDKVLQNFVFALSPWSLFRFA